MYCAALHLRSATPRMSDVAPGGLASAAQGKMSGKILPAARRA